MLAMVTTSVVCITVWELLKMAYRKGRQNIHARIARWASRYIECHCKHVHSETVN